MTLPKIWAVIKLFHAHLCVTITELFWGEIFVTESRGVNQSSISQCPCDGWHHGMSPVIIVLIATNNNSMSPLMLGNWLFYYETGWGKNNTAQRDSNKLVWSGRGTGRVEESVTNLLICVCIVLTFTRQRELIRGIMPGIILLRCCERSEIKMVQFDPNRSQQSVSLSGGISKQWTNR